MKTKVLKRATLLTVALTFFILGNIPLASASSPSQSPTVSFSPVANRGPVSPLTAHVTLLCGGIIYPTGQVTGTGGSFIEDYYGNLYWCVSGTATLIAARPSDAITTGGPAYQFMAGIKTSLGMVLVLSDTLDSGMWFCIGATSAGCSLTSHFVTVCGGTCVPEGIYIDKHLNIFFVNFGASQILKCTYASAYQTCTVYQTITGGDGPQYAMYMSSTGHTWVTDAGCGGDVWHDGTVLGSDPNAGYSWSITVSSANPEKAPHVYVGASTACTSTGNAGVYDFTEGHFLNTPLTGADDIFGLTTKLQFSAIFTGNVYLVKDTI